MVASVPARDAVSVLFAWELGAGIGHIAPILPLAENLIARGHRVTVAARELDSARRLFQSLPVRLVAAPFGGVAADDRIRPPRSYTHILHNTGYARADKLLEIAGAWRAVIREVGPDLVVCDHSPTAMLASRAEAIPVVATGTGFCCPPDSTPMPDFRPWMPDAAEQLYNDEQRVLANVNRVMQAWNQSPYEQLSHVLHRDSRHFLATFSELDHYPDRAPAEYWGTWTLATDNAPEWPDTASRRRAVAYLRPTPNVTELLSLLSYFGVSTLVHCPGMSEAAKLRLSGPNLTFVEQPMDLPTLVRRSDFAVLYASHGSTSACLLAGKPILQVPFTLEQTMTAAAVERLGAGIRADMTRPLSLSETIARFLDSDGYATAAQQFSQRYQDFDAKSQSHAVASELENIALERRKSSAWTPLPRKSPMPWVLIGLGANPRGLRQLADACSRMPTVATPQQSLAALPWMACNISDAAIQDRFAAIANGCPEAAVVSDAASYYLPYVEQICRCFPHVSFLCVRHSRSETIDELVQSLAVNHSNQPINYWSLDRTGFDEHPLDVSYPKYDTRNIIDAIDRYWKEYDEVSRTLARRYRGQFRIVASETLRDETAAYALLAEALEAVDR